MFSFYIGNPIEIITIFHLATQVYIFTLWTTSQLFNNPTSHLLRGGPFFIVMLLNLCGLPPFPLFFVKFWIIGVATPWSKLSLLLIITLINILTTWLYLSFIKRITTLNTAVKGRNLTSTQVHVNLQATLFVWTLLLFINPWLFL